MSLRSFDQDVLESSFLQYEHNPISIRNVQGPWWRYMKDRRNRRVSKKPLIRLNVKCCDERQIFNTIRFGQNYMGKVANPEDMIKCNMIREKKARTKGEANSSSHREIDMDIVSAVRVEDIVSSFFEEKDTLKIFPVSIINEAVKKFIDASDNDAISDVTELYKKQIMKKLEDDMPDIADVLEAIKNFKIEREHEAVQHITNLLVDPKRPQNISREGSNQEKEPTQSARSKRVSNQEEEPTQSARSKRVCNLPGSLAQSARSKKVSNKKGDLAQFASSKQVSNKIGLENFFTSKQVSNQTGGLTQSASSKQVSNQIAGRAPSARVKKESNQLGRQAQSSRSKQKNTSDDEVSIIIDDDDDDDLSDLDSDYSQRSLHGESRSYFLNAKRGRGSRGVKRFKRS